MLEQRPLILLLDNLADYVSSVLDLPELVSKLTQHSPACVMAATCRDGKEQRTITQTTGTGFYRLLEDIPLILRLIPLNTDEKEKLALSIGKPWNSSEAGMLPTPGSITMAEPLKGMAQRFIALGPVEKDVLRALQLLAAGGILPFAQRRLNAVLQGVFRRQDAHIEDHLGALAEEAFLSRPASQDPVCPEPAYLLHAVSYGEGKSPQDDLPGLGDVLSALRDTGGLLCLGITCLGHGRTLDLAISCLSRATDLSP